MSVRKNDECCKESAKKGAQAMHDIMKSELEQERKKSAELVEAAQSIVGECIGMMAAHEFTIRQDSGNTNFEVYRGKLRDYRKALTKHKGESE